MDGGIGRVLRSEYQQRGGPRRWTSADAAGLAILPGLVRYDEVLGADEIRHAFRVTVRATNGYVWPASHRAGSNSQALPMGARLRLKARRTCRPIRRRLQKIFRAMQRYGLIVADNGSDMYVSGAFDPRWNNDILNPAFRSLTASDFDVIELGWRGGAERVVPRRLARRRRSASRRAADASCLSGLPLRARRTTSSKLVPRRDCRTSSSRRWAPRRRSARSRRRAATTRGCARAMAAVSARRPTRSWSRSEPGRPLNCDSTGNWKLTERQYPIASPSFRGSDPPISTPVAGRSGCPESRPSRRGRRTGGGRAPRAPA